ncbi:MAG TPA: D-hexose-6-phosphate mutarotase [Gemmatimonadaceae bacterium]|nr:D-hexose-6-phosphate mutarotase [Gemmatimonadaceae bacterium]
MSDLDFDSDRRLFIKRLAGAGLAVGVTGFAACTKSPSVAPEPEPVKGPPPPTTVRGRIGDLETIPLRHASGSSAEIAIQGAHVTSWKRASGDEMLFLSANSRFSPEQTIRGGIPVIFPQFAALGPLPGHGFLKTALWEVGDVGRDPGGSVFALLRTRDTDATRALWPHAFRATMRVTLDESLSTAITIENTGTEAFPFHCALHTYLRVADLRKVSIEGLEGASYQDRTAKGVVRRERRRPLTVRGEVNRIYMARPDRLRIVDASRGRAILIDRAGFNDVVVWNPGKEKARTATGLADGEYLTMLAVESAQIVPPVQLLPGSLWSGVQRIRLS